MQAEIITIGDEILIGQIVDTNSAYIANALNKIGISVYQVTSVQDERQHILNALAKAQNQVDLVIVTGGLGPTKDDITKTTFCDFFDDILVKNTEIHEHVKQLYRNYVGHDPKFDAPILNQALVPSKALVFKNELGTAPGMWMSSSDNTIFISLPGVPYEMKGLMQKKILPKLKQHFKRPVILHKTLLTEGMGESAIAQIVEDWENNLPAHIKLAYLPSIGRVRLRLSLKGTDKAVLEKELDQQIHALKKLIDHITVGFEDEGSIEQIIGQHLLDKKQSLSIAESCTGGQLAHQITIHPGASSFFKGSVVTYATRSKTDVLAVPEKLIEKHGVVSSQVAEAMAEQTKKIFNTHYAISTTGVAGPDKGDTQDKVGTVFIGIASPKGVFSEKFNFVGNREMVIKRATNKALELLRKQILKN